MLWAGVPRVGGDEDAPRDGALRSQSQRPLQLPRLPLGLCLGVRVRVEPFASSVATSAVTLLSSM